MGSFHVTLSAIAEWRVEEAVPILVSMIGFNLAPATFPVGDRRPSIAYYPVAHALSTIQGKVVVAEIIKLLSQPVNDAKLRASAWVLRECLGREIGPGVIACALAKSTDRQKKQNLAALLVLVTTDPVILRLPK